MTLAQQQKFNVLSLELGVARYLVASTLCNTLAEKCAAQDALCRAILALEMAKKEGLVRQMTADVASMKARLEFLDTHVVCHPLVYERMMTTGVAIEELIALNTLENTQE